jgi:hypothetical protein
MPVENCTLAGDLRDEFDCDFRLVDTDNVYRLRKSNGDEGCTTTVLSLFSNEVVKGIDPPSSLLNEKLAFAEAWSIGAEKVNFKTGALFIPTRPAVFPFTEAPEKLKVAGVTGGGVVVVESLFLQLFMEINKTISV